MAENRDKFAAVDGEVYIAKCRRGLGFALLLRLIGISYILNSINFSLIFIFSTLRLRRRAGRAPRR